MGISGLLRSFTIYQEFKLYFRAYVYKSLIWVSKLHASKTDYTMSPNCSRIMPGVMKLNLILYVKVLAKSHQ